MAAVMRLCFRLVLLTTLTDDGDVVLVDSNGDPLLAG